MGFAQSLVLSLILSVVATLILWQFQSMFNLNAFWTIVIGFIIGFGLSYLIYYLMRGRQTVPGPATTVVMA